MSERELIERAKQGDSTALYKLWVLWKRLVYLKCRRYLKEGASYDMDDIMQTAFIGFTKAVELYDLDEKVGLMTYAMYHIKKAVLRDVLGIDRKRNVIDEAVSLDKPLPCDEDLTLIDTTPNESAVDIEAHIVWSNAAEIIRQAVQLLNDKQQELIRLRFYEGLQYKHISKITGLTVSGARDGVKQAQNKLWRIKAVRELKEELFPENNYRVPAELQAIRNIEAEQRFWKRFARYAPL